MELTPMIVIMFISGILSTMNVWAYRKEDIRLTLNDLYMAALMVGWMLLLMGIYSQSGMMIVSGIVVVGIFIFCIRTQLFITPTQYMKGMIPHHSMAILMSDRLIKREDVDNPLRSFAEEVIDTQEEEIGWLKDKLQNN